MQVGTKSVLFGVHQFLWHPITVGLAWRKFHGSWPAWWQWIAIFCHDIGYWGKPNMDGREGQSHPYAGARLAKRIVKQIGFWLVENSFDGDEKLRYLCGITFDLCLYHSSAYAKSNGQKTSELYWPDKLSIFYDPQWFYLLRARLSGEAWEYLRVNAPGWLTWADDPLATWLAWYRGIVALRLKRWRKNKA